MIENKIKAIIYLIAGVLVLFPFLLSVLTLYPTPPEFSTYLMVFVVCFIFFFFVFIRKVWKGES